MILQFISFPMMYDTLQIYVIVTLAYVHLKKKFQAGPDCWLVRKTKLITIP